MVVKELAIRCVQVDVVTLVTATLIAEMEEILHEQRRNKN